MSDESTTPAENTSDDVHELSRKDRNAARRAEFETAKAAKDAEKSAEKDLKAQGRLAVKENKQEKIAQVRAQKDAAKAAKKSKKSKKSVEDTQDVTTHTEVSEKTANGKPRKEQRTKPEKVAKDPYRPRFATAPAKVRALTVVSALFVMVHVLGAALLLLETSSSPLLGVLPEDASALAYLGALAALLVATLWMVSAALLCAGRVLGKPLGVIALVLSLPLSLIAAPLLFSNDVRDWAL